MNIHIRNFKCEIRNQHTCLPIIHLEISLYLKYKCGFYSPITLIQSGQTNKQTHKQTNNNNNIDYCSDYTIV